MDRMLMREILKQLTMSENFSGTSGINQKQESKSSKLVNLKKSRQLRLYYQDYSALMHTIARKLLSIHYSTCLNEDDLVWISLFKTYELMKNYQPEDGKTLLSYLYTSWKNVMLGEISSMNSQSNRFNYAILAKEGFEFDWVEGDDTIKERILRQDLYLMMKNEDLSEQLAFVVRKIIVNDFNPRDVYKTRPWSKYEQKKLASEWKKHLKWVQN
ncbi:sigma factor [Mycoplasmopsis agassizii]|uniref:sigma factor n=1 Tax=Mycoplasmopsis agassizii TaxID=33922 RepID=UPI00117C2964|nr:sigma factor [Mycoplasmopsis agassizii]